MQEKTIPEVSGGGLVLHDRGLFFDDEFADHPAMTGTALDRTLEIINTRTHGKEFDDAFLAFFDLGVALRVIKKRTPSG